MQLKIYRHYSDIPSKHIELYNLSISIYYINFIKRGLVRKTITIPYLFLVKIILVLSVMINNYFIFFHLNPSLVDMAGHFGSAKTFSAGLFHSYTDQNFLGTIQNLFYPPMQDFLISFIAYFTHENFLLAGKIYLSITYLFFIFSIYKLTDIFHNNKTKLFFILILFLYLFSRNYENQTFQGFTIFDQLATGLITQFLGVGFLFFLIRILLMNKAEIKNKYVISILLGMCALSHIVSFLVAFSIVFLFIVIRKEYYLIKSSIYGFLIGSLFLIPFIFNLKYVAKTNIFEQNYNITFSFSIICLFFIFIFYNSKEKKFPILIFFSISIFILNFTGQYLFSIYKIKFLPDFHYYRICIYALIFLIIEIAMLYDSYLDEKINLKDFKKNPQVRNKINLVLLYSIILICLVISGHRLFFNELFDDSFFMNNITINANKNIFTKSKQTFGRSIFIVSNNPGDQNLAEYLRLLDINLQTANGVYWENSLTNYLFVSYNSLLFKESSGILDRWWKNIENCNEYNCFLEQFIRDYNINTIIIDENFKNNTLPEKTKTCLQKALNNRETIFYKFEKQGEFTLSDKFELNKTYSVFHVEQKNKDFFSNSSPIELIHIAYYKKYKPTETNFFGNYFNNTLNYCLSTYPNKINYASFLDSRFINKFVNIKNISLDFKNVNNINFSKVKKNEYNITIDSKIPVFFKIKLSYFPGLKLLDENKKEVPLVPGISYVVGYGKGNMTLIFERGYYYYISYVLSIIFFIYCSIQIFRNKKPPRA
jgi:hypothetical protein